MLRKSEDSITSEEITEVYVMGGICEGGRDNYTNPLQIENPR